jgi:circadian clock protein KaiC
MERKALYYTMVSEPHSKLVRHLEQFEFFDEAAIGERIELIHLPSLLNMGSREQSPKHRAAAVDQLADEIVRASWKEERSVIVIDGIKALRDFAEGHGFGFRGIAYDLASKISHSNAVLIFVGEYTADEVAYAPEFAVADGILYLADEPQAQFDQRWLRILKLRGTDFLMGKHTLRIDKRGLEVYPRFEAVASRDVVRAGEDRTGVRLQTGVGGIDDMVGGGLPHSTTTLVAGPSGSGKTVLGLQFIAEGIKRGERCLYLSFQQSPEQLVARGEAFGWPFRKAVEVGLLSIQQLAPVEMSLDAVGADLRRAASLDGAMTRVVVDSLAELEPAARGTNRFPDFLVALTAMFSSIGATSLLTSETSAFFGGGFELTHGLAFVADNVILLRYAELHSEVRRALAIIKMRNGDHVRDIVEVEIATNGMIVKGKFHGLTGILGGTPTVAAPPR